MSTMTSAWQTGTYDLLVYQDPDAEPGALMLVVFAAPTDPNDKAADEDAPILAHIDVSRADYDHELAEFMKDLHSCGDNGLIRPEDVEKIYGTVLGERVLTAMHDAAIHDAAGMDMDLRPFRGMSDVGLDLAKRITPILEDMRGRLSGS